MKNSNMQNSRYTDEELLQIIRDKTEELGRLPLKSDIPEYHFIKCRFGPWPRALEAAGVKPPRSDDRATHNKEKRIRAKRRRTMAKKQKTEENQNEKTEK